MFSAFNLSYSFILTVTSVIMNLLLEDRIMTEFQLLAFSSFSKVPWWTLGPTLPHNQWVVGAVSPAVSSWGVRLTTTLVPRPGMRGTVPHLHSHCMPLRRAGKTSPVIFTFIDVYEVGLLHTETVCVTPTLRVFWLAVCKSATRVTLHAFSVSCCDVIGVCTQFSSCLNVK